MPPAAFGFAQKGAVLCCGDEYDGYCCRRHHPDDAIVCCARHGATDLPPQSFIANVKGAMEAGAQQKGMGEQSAC